MSNIKKNFSYSVFYQILNLIIPLITTPYIARVIGVEGVGIYSYTYAIVQYFVLFIMLGIANYGSRTIAKVKDNLEVLRDNFWNMYIMQMFSFFLVTIAFVIFILFSKSDYHIYLIIEYIFLLSACLDVNWLFFGLEKFKITVIKNAIIKVLSTACIFMFVKDSNDLLLYVIIVSAANFCTNIVLWPYILKNIKFSKISIKKIIKHFRGNIILFIPVLAISIYNIMDKIMLGGLINVGEVGLYENTEKIINVPLNIITALGTVMLPHISNLVSKQKNDKVLSYIDKTMKFSVFITVPIVFGLFLTADNFVKIYLGNGFVNAGIMVKTLSIVILFKVWANIIRTQYLIPNEMDKSYITSVLLGAITNFVLNWMLIPRYGGMGAIIGTVFAELIVAIYQTIVVSRKLPINHYIMYLVRAIITGLIMYLCIVSFNYFNLNPYVVILLQVALGTVVYMILNLKYILTELNISKIINKLRRSE